MRRVGIPRAADMNEYLELIKEALYEVRDVRAAGEFDDGFMDATSVYTDALEPVLVKMVDDIENDTYQFSKEALPFMTMVRAASQLALPFRPLLMRINDTHMNGFEGE